MPESPFIHSPFHTPFTPQGDEVQYDELLTEGGVFLLQEDSSHIRL